MVADFGYRPSLEVTGTVHQHVNLPCSLSAMRRTLLRLLSIALCDCSGLLRKKGVHGSSNSPTSQDL